MAKRSNYPHYSIATSVAVRKGKYKKGPSFGLWNGEGKVVARGSVKENYLEELADFLNRAAEKDYSVSFALFKNSKFKSRDEDDDEDDDEDEDDEEEEDDDEEEEEEEEKPKRKKKVAKKSGKKKGKKKKGWSFDDDDDD